MSAVLSDFVAEKVCKALGIDIPDGNYAIIIRLVAGELAIVEFVNWGDGKLEDVDWLVLGDAKIERKELTDAK